MWRAYVVANVYGRRQVMRDINLYSSFETAVNNFKAKNKEWMKMNYGPQFVRSGDFEYGAIKEGSKFKFGPEGNDEVLKYHKSLKSGNDRPFFSYF